MPSFIRLVEYQERFLDHASLTESDALYLHSKYASQVELDWPTPLTGGRWRLRSKGWVGFLPLEGGRGILLEPKVPIRNIIAMLGYAFDLRAFSFQSGAFKAESIWEFFDRLAQELARRILARGRRGLRKEYRVQQVALPFVRGRLDFTTLIGRPVLGEVECEFDDQTEDVEDNRILAWTLHVILLSGMCSQSTVSVVRKADKLLQGTIKLERYSARQCLGRVYDRLNSDYEPMHLLCRFFLECLSPSQNAGEKDTIPFLLDMASLFEVFVARWLCAHLDPSLVVRVQDSKTIGTGGDLKLTPDIVIYKRGTKKALCILDTKYKAQGNVSSSDWSQVVSYAEALDCLHSFLVYPLSLSRPFDEKPGRIRVTSSIFDLDGDMDSAGKAFLDSLLPALKT